MHDRDYVYKQVPITPAIIESLTGELFSGQLVERQTIVDEVTRVHLARGGKSSDAQSATASVKKALSNMAQRGAAENPSRGHWRILTIGSHTGIPVPQDLAVPLPVTAAEESPPLVDFIGTPPVAELALGAGSGAIYVYYLPMYRQHAQQLGESVWPCKLGRTDRDPLERILAQAATALPERPVVALVLRTSLPVAWEAALHGVLTIRGLKIKDSPGSEWFLTSPEEVLSLMHSFDPSLAPSNECNSSPICADA